MNEKFNKLTVYALKPEQMSVANHPYKYLVYNNYMNHTAFKTRAGLNNWLAMRNLVIDGNLVDGESRAIVGEYATVCLLSIDPTLPDYSNVMSRKEWDSESFDEFGISNGLQKSYIMDNGDWTTAYIFHGMDANTHPMKETTVIYYLNPNCKRTVYDWRKFEDGIFVG